MRLSIPLVSGLLLAARANAQQQPGCANPSGRYWRAYQLEPTNGAVRVPSNAGGYSWHITELRLFDSSGQSLAIAACDSEYLRSGNGGTGWKDGTLGGAFDCRNAYDGDPSSYSPRRENLIEGGMISVDLGATYTVSTVEMTSLDHHYSPGAWVLQSSDDRETWSDVSDIMRPGCMNYVNGVGITCPPLETTWTVYDPRSMGDDGSCLCDGFRTVQHGRVVCAACNGDMDDNQKVDVYDILALLGDFGLCDPRLISDGNNDGCVGVQDLMLLLEEFGRDCSASRGL
jgi:hypothetical protein